MPNLSNNFVITGASRGIGLELTLQALSEGNEVSAVVRNPDSAERLQALKSQFPNLLHVFKADVTSDTDVGELASSLSKGRPVDVLINNAGVLHESEAELETLDLDKVAESFEINSIAPLRVTRALLPLLKKSQNPRLINITSLMGSISDNTGGGAYGYRMSKAALNMFNKSLSVDQPEIISVVVHPGWVKTDMGGPQALTETAESAAGIHALIRKLTPAQTGEFFDFEGNEIGW